MSVKYIFFFFMFICLANHTCAQVVWEGRVQDPDSLVKKGMDYVRENRFDESIDLARTVLAKYPTYSDFVYILGISYLKMNRPIWAEQYYRKVIASSPDYYDAYYGLAHSLWKQGRLDEADHVWETLPDSIVQSDYVKQLHHDFITETMGEKDEKRIETIKRTIKDLPASAGLQRLDSLLLKSPDRLDLLELKADLLFATGRDAEATAILEHLISKDETRERTLLRIADIYAQQKDFNKAYAIMDTLVALNPRQTTYQRLRLIYDDQKVYKNYIAFEQGFLTYDRPVGTFFMSGFTYGTKLRPSISLSGQVNWAHLRNGKGFQYLVESWMNYSKTLYSYNSVGFSDSYAFPKWRAAYSLYKEFKSWQYDIGVRYMYPHIGLDNLTGVLSIGKYVGPNFFYLRSFLTYNQERTETAFAVSWRYYYNEEKPETYFTIIGNIGTSPDDPERYMFYADPSVFKSYAVTMGIQHRIGKYVLGSNGSWSVYKITDLNYLHQYNLNLSVKRYF